MHAKSLERVFGRETIVERFGKRLTNHGENVPQA